MMTYSKSSKRKGEDLFKIQQERRRRGLSIGVNVISTHCWWFFFFFSVHEGEREKKGKDGLR